MAAETSDPRGTPCGSFVLVRRRSGAGLLRSRISGIPGALVDSEEPCALPLTFSSASAVALIPALAGCSPRPGEPGPNAVPPAVGGGRGSRFRRPAGRSRRAGPTPPISARPSRARRGRAPSRPGRPSRSPSSRGGSRIPGPWSRCRAGICSSRRNRAGCVSCPQRARSASPSPACPKWIRRGPGRPARRRARTGVRDRPGDLLELLRAPRRRQRDERRPRDAVGRPAASGRRSGDLPGDADARRPRALRFAARVRAGRHALRDARRALRHSHTTPGTAHGQPHGQDPAHPPGRLGAGRQPLRRPGRGPAGDLDAGPQKRPVRGAGCERPSLGSGAWTAGRRRAEPRREGEELRMAARHVRRGILRVSDLRRGDRPPRFRAPGLLLGPGDRALRGGVLHGRRVSRRGAETSSSGVCGTRSSCVSSWRTIG